MAIEKEELIHKYVKAIKEGNAAVFAGAGLSQPSGFVNWKELLRPLAKDIGLDIEKEKDYLAVAQFYKNRKGSTTPISQEILNAFGKDARINENMRILARLPIFTYWTTNYDELLENGIREANRNPDVKSDYKQLPIMLPNRDAIVYKMHGDVKHPTDAVLTKTDYELYSNKYPMFRTLLEGDLISKKFLFIGFSFEDPNLDYVLGQIRSLLGEKVPEHFWFAKRAQLKDYKNPEEYRYTVARQELQEENLRSYGIQTVFVDEWPEVTDILLAIEKASKMKNVFISGSASDFNKPWDKSKAEELASKLAAELVRDDCRITSGFGLGIGSSVVNGALDVIYTEKFKHVDEHLCLRPFPQNISDPIERDNRWTRYREDMLTDTGISIFLFGNKFEGGKIVEANGCIQEFRIARDKGNIIIPIGSTGFAAATILNEVKSNIADYSYLETYIDVLEKETNIGKIINVIKEIINNIQN